MLMLMVQMTLYDFIFFSHNKIIYVNIPWLAWWKIALEHAINDYFHLLHATTLLKFVKNKYDI